MNTLAILHIPNEDWAYSEDRFSMRFKLRVPRNEVSQVTLITIDKYLNLYGIGEQQQHAMDKVAYDDYYDYYEVVVKEDVLVIKYFFLVTSVTGEIVQYGQGYIGTYDNQNKNQPYFDRCMNSTFEDRHQVPLWMKEAIVYQIFPERFYRGDAQSDISEWYDPITHETKLGGTIQGIMDKLDYIHALGVTVIYLTPIFQSTSSHKYNTKDYYTIDPDFGTNEDFKVLIDAVHAKGMYLMIDGVFNHTGDDFFAFEDVREKGEQSPYYHWFDVRKFPLEHQPHQRPTYETFGYYYKMPKIMHRNPEAAAYFIEVGRYWTKMGIDGWRLDVADEVSSTFWRDFRNAVKSVNSEAAIVGEVWYDSALWLRGDQFDSVMNYGFRSALIQFLGEKKTDALQFLTQLSKIRGQYKKSTYDVLWNLIDSHDTARFLHKANEDKQKLKMATLVQMTYAGAPFIYYGDEAGMTGGNDPDCRRGMLWHENHRDDEMFAYFQKLICLRKEYGALRSGAFETYPDQEQPYVAIYHRVDQNHRFVIALNMSDQSVHLKEYEQSKDLIHGGLFLGELGVNQGVLLLKKH